MPKGTTLPLPKMVIQQGNNKDSFGVTFYLSEIATKYLEDTWGKKSSGKSHFRHLKKFFVTDKGKDKEKEKGKEKDNDKRKDKSKNKENDKESGKGKEKEKGKTKGKEKDKTRDKKKLKGKRKGKGKGKSKETEKGDKIDQEGEKPNPEEKKEQEEAEGEKTNPEEKEESKPEELENLSSSTYIGQCAEGTTLSPWCLPALLPLSRLLMQIWQHRKLLSGPHRNH